jgi:hypothetical protein
VFSSLEVSQSLFGFLRIYSIQYELLTKDLHFPDQSDSNLWHLFFLLSHLIAGTDPGVQPGFQDCGGCQPFRISR